MRPKIVHYLYEPGDGGLDRVAILLANGMAERGYPTELWMTKDEGPVADLISNAVTVRLVPTPGFGNRGFQLIAQIPALQRMIEEHRPDAILSAGNQSNFTVAHARNRSKHPAMRVIQKITNPIIRPNMGSLRIAWRKRRFGLTAKMGDRCLTLSAPDARAYQKLFPHSADKFHPVHNAYVTPEMLAIGEARAPAQPDGPARLLAVGRIAVQKDYATMLRALHHIRHLDWHLTVLGDGPLLEETQALARELNIENRVDFKGFVTNPGPYYAKSDFLLLSSRWEGFPAVPLEAMAAGCDVVATDCAAGLTEILAGIGRAATPVEDATAFAKSIGEAIAHPSHCESLIEIAQSYSLNASVEDHLRQVEEVIAAR